MAPSLDVCFPVGAFGIPDRKIHKLEIVFRGSKEQIEIAERIEVAEVRTVGGNGVIRPLAEGLGAAQRVFDVLAQQPGEREAEEAIAEAVRAATDSGVSLQISHISSVARLAYSSRWAIEQALEQVAQARTNGLDVNVDMQPRSLTLIEVK